MITPRRTRLLRAPDLHAYQRAVVSQALVRDPWRARSTAVIVPTRAAAAVLTREIESSVARLDRSDALTLPHLVTRDSWYREMHTRSGSPLVLLTAVEREVFMLSAARSGPEPPFRLRPGLVPAIVELYDQLRRHRRTVDAFERLVQDELEPSVDLDRGARRLLRQTAFLVATFRRYEEHLAERGCVDEHGLRAWLTDRDGPATFSRIVVTIPDHIVDSAGLWAADYDLLTRLPGLEQIDVLATERVLDAGFHERLRERLPGMEEERLDARDAPRPAIVTPAEGQPGYFVCRDREEEILAIARSVKLPDLEPGRHPVGVVFRRPLPYLYLARDLLGRAGIAFTTYDGLPLAAESFAAAVDLVCAFVTSGYDRASTRALLRCPYFDFSRLRGSGSTEDAELADRLAAELEPIEGPASASRILDGLRRFLSRHAAPIVSAGLSAREQRARTAVFEAIDDLAAAHDGAALDQSERAPADVFAMLRRWVEERTIALDLGTPTGGVQLLDPRAAVYGRFDQLFIVGLVDGEWPERSAGNIFYPSSLLVPLGWPVERDRMRARRAQFADLLELPSFRVTLSTISLENDAIVTPSTLLEELDDVGLARVPSVVDPGVSITPDDAWAFSAVRPDDFAEPMASWIRVRGDGVERDRGVARGNVGPRPPEPYAVGALERYLECPFKYLAERVLKLEEESADERMSAAQRRGLFLHAVFESFFSTWRDPGHGHSITTNNLEAALARFRELAETALADLPTSERAVTRSWMLGSAAAPGLAERLFSLEVGHPADVVDRLTELRVDGEFVLTDGDRTRTVRLRGVADRVDLFADGTFRVVDYKANRAPDRSRALQLPLYARCAEQQLEGRSGRRWRAVEATYAAFGEPRLHLPIGRRHFNKEVIEGQRRALDVIERIERGEFPVQPAELFRCNFCAYPTVCRKDYVGDD